MLVQDHHVGVSLAPQHRQVDELQEGLRRVS
jgi:hypothetical protein